MPVHPNRILLAVNDSRSNNRQRADSISSSSSSMNSRGSLQNRAYSSSFISDYQSTQDYEGLSKSPNSPSTTPSDFYYYQPRVEGSFSSDSYASNARNTFNEPNSPLPPIPNRSTSTTHPSQRLEQWPEEETRLIFPPTEGMIEQARSRLLEIESKPLKVLYAGDATYKPDKGILSKTKRVHFVLTHRYLLVYKTAQKARMEIDMYEHQHQQSKQSVDKSRILLNLSDIYAVHITITVLNTFRIDYLHPQSSQTMSHTITAETSKECKQWVQALRSAIHPLSIETVSTPERYAAIDRVSKQSDVFENTDSMKMYKVVFKEKRFKATGGDVPREFFLPVILVFGKFSFYLLPVSVTDDEYLKTVERDRFGYLSIQSIRYDGLDDTVYIQVRQANKASRQLVFASAHCKDIVCYLYRSIQSIVPLPLFQFNVPEDIRGTHILPFRLPPDPEDEMTGHDDEEIQTFNIVLRGYAAALNLNKSRFNFSIVGPHKEKWFVLLPPHEINKSPPVYQKYELLALLRTIQANAFFSELCFSNHPLDALECWKIDSNDGWTVHVDSPASDDYVFSNELQRILSHKLLRKLDLTNCSMGNAFPDGTLKKASAISAIGMAMQSGTTCVSRLSLGQNRMSRVDFATLMEGIKKHKKSIKELYLHECGLEREMIEIVLRTLLENNPEQMISLDLSSETMAIDPSLVSKMTSNFKRLEILRMRGCDLMKNGFDLENTHLRELDMSNVKLSTDTVSRLCQWIQHPSFRTIEALHLANCGLNGRHAYELLHSISRSGNRQMHLNLAENPIMKEVMHLPKLYSAIVQGEGPSSISFACTEWDDSTLCEFIDCLRDNQTITHLILTDVKLRDTEEISADTVQMMTSLFERNTMIRELQLGFNKYKPVRSHFSLRESRSLFASALTQALYGLRHNSVLQHLDISGLNMGDAGALALARALKTNQTLQSVHIDDNNITIEGYRHLLKVIQEKAVQVIDIPIPRNDLRFQLGCLAYRIEELVISQNEAHFFLIHTVAGDKKRAKTHELDMFVQERKSCELALKSIEGVVQSLMIAIQRNARHHEEQRERTLEFQLQAQAAAQELAVAQVRLQGRSNSINSFNLNAVGGASTTSSVTSSIRKGRTNSNASTYHDPYTRAAPSQRRSYVNNGYRDSRIQPIRREDPSTKQYYYGAPITPSGVRREFTDNSLALLSPPLINHTDDPGFIEDFGYVDDFELDIESYVDYQKPNLGSADPLWDEDRIVDHFSRRLYFPPDARD